MTATTVSASSVAVSGVRKQFGAKVALDDVTLDAGAGTFLVLLGPSGSGKTTLLRCLAGIERPSAGSIEIGGRVVAGPGAFVGPERRDLAMVFQDYALWPHLTVARNVAFPLARSTRGREGRAARVGDLLERVGIAHLADRYPNELSGGEQQRVALARALAADVGLILFDEPLSNLDADRREQLRVEIATLTRAAGVTAVYITHDQSEAFALADQIGVLNHGRLVQCGSPEEIYRQPASAFVARFTGLAGEFPAAAFEPDGPGLYRVTLSFAPDVPVRAHAVAPLAADDAAHLFVRSAGVVLHPVTSPEGVPGLVRDVAFTGRGYEHVVEVGAGAALTKVFAAQRHERGRAVRVSFSPDACFVMRDTESGEVPS